MSFEMKARVVATGAIVLLFVAFSFTSSDFLDRNGGYVLWPGIAIFFYWIIRHALGEFFA